MHYGLSTSIIIILYIIVYMYTMYIPFVAHLLVNNVSVSSSSSVELFLCVYVFSLHVEKSTSLHVYV